MPVQGCPPLLPRLSRLGGKVEGWGHTTAKVKGLEVLGDCRAVGRAWAAAAGPGSPLRCSWKLGISPTETMAPR